MLNGINRFTIGRTLIFLMLNTASGSAIFTVMVASVLL